MSFCGFLRSGCPAGVRAFGAGLLLLAFWCLLAGSIYPVEALPVNRPFAATTNHLVISQFRARGSNGGNDEFIELFNPTGGAIDISNWTIKRSNDSGFAYLHFTFPASTILLSGQYYLLTNSAGYNDAVPGDKTYAVGLTDSGGLALLSADGVVVDQVGFGVSSFYGEGTKLTSLGASKDIDRSYRRKPGGLLGACEDSDNNVADFELIDPSAPLTSSTIVSNPCAGTSTPTPTPTLTATLTSTVAPLASATLIPTLTATPTNTIPPLPTVTLSPTATVTLTGPPTPTVTATSTATSTKTGTPTSTATATLTVTASSLPALTATATKTATVTLTVSPTLTATVSPTPYPVRGLVINEVAWMGTTADLNDEWIELYNPGLTAVNLAGWKLQSVDGAPSISLTGSIAAGGYFLLERTDDEVISDIPADQIYSGVLSNETESLQLLAPGGSLADSANSNGGAWPAGNSVTACSMERRGAEFVDGDTAWITNTGQIANGEDIAGNKVCGTPKMLNWAYSVTPTAVPTATTTRTATPHPQPDARAYRHGRSHCHICPQRHACQNGHPHAGFGGACQCGHQRVFAQAAFRSKWRWENRFGR